MPPLTHTTITKLYAVGKILVSSPIDIHKRLKGEEGARVVGEQLGQEGGTRAPGGEQEDVERLGVGQRFQGPVGRFA